MKAISEIEGLEAVVENVLQGEEKLIRDIKYILMFAKIKREYKRLKEQREPGQTDVIKTELALKYFNNPDRIRMINSILYEKCR